MSVQPKQIFFNGPILECMSVQPKQIFFNVYFHLPDSSPLE
uniref:Uncharacterized protein n=1 Tax=Arundo donax TaxID=35708 RepID=A0A0A9AGT5_ARUDO